LRSRPLSDHRRPALQQRVLLPQLPTRQRCAIGRLVRRCYDAIHTAQRRTRNVPVIGTRRQELLRNMRDTARISARRRPDAIELTTATLDDPERFPPTREIWHLQKVSWAAPNPALVHYGRDSQGESDSVS